MDRLCGVDGREGAGVGGVQKADRHRADGNRYAQLAAGDDGDGDGDLRRAARPSTWCGRPSTRAARATSPAASS